MSRFVVIFAAPIVAWVLALILTFAVDHAPILAGGHSGGERGGVLDAGKPAHPLG